MTEARCPTFDAGLLGCMPALKRGAMRLVRNVVAAEDLVQDTLAKAIRNHHLFEPGSNMSAWLQTIMRNTFLSQVRKRRSEIEDVDGTYAAAVEVRGAQEGVLELADVRARLRFMPKHLRDVLLMNVEDGMAYEEIAERLDVPLGTVKSRINRARAFLDGEETGPMLVEQEEAMNVVSQASVRDLYMDGRSISEIAEAMGISAIEVMTEVARLGLSGKRKAKAGVARAA